MIGQTAVDSPAARPAFTSHRERLLSGLPVAERRLELAGVSTSVLAGGSGPPIVLLHGPGEFAAKWRSVLPDLASTHSGIVCVPAPAVNSVTITSSNDRANARSAPETSALRMPGNVIRRNVIHVSAPRSADASSEVRGSRRRRAIPLL